MDDPNFRRPFTDHAGPVSAEHMQNFYLHWNSWLIFLRGYALWPIPTTLETGLAALKVSPEFYFDVQIEGAPSDLHDAVAQSQYYLENDNFRRLVVDRGANDTTALASAMTLSKLTLSLASGASAQPISSEAVKPLGTRSEEYALTIPADGSAATLTANSTLGLYRGLTTFNQIFYHFEGVTYTLLAPIAITDTPAYPFRGLGLDTSRNYYAVSDILRTLDAMSWVKINTFHWHITDSQSFPLEVAQYPELAINGAYSRKEVYTASDVQHIVQYAAARGIDVMMEIDTPGHTAIIGATYPEYVACFDASPWADFAWRAPCRSASFCTPRGHELHYFLAHRCQRRPSLHTILAPGAMKSTRTVMPTTYLTQQQLNMTGMTLNGALDRFTQTTHGALIAQGKTPVVWEEMVLDWNITLSNEDYYAAAVAERGLRIIQAPSNYFYLDTGAGEWLGDNPTGSSSPFKTWSEASAYTFDPLANLTEAQYELVLGGEQILWSEQSGPQNIDPIVWPRAASSAEIFWSGKQPTGAALNVTEALPRLHDIRYRMVQRGVNAIPLQPQWCALRPDACDG
ncbi:glycoside hydrolase family 20 protein [Suillus bovinus]|uniref:glycoside hydrolase family 20 protein n=1 Tax=Suillus bovinus TaxID=48563 RepID=UPI001B86168B|nr:glycoside hydrolase family 20 protein [Suillus bovinus]KAG2139115.1 glycoside hydrolase family 20 protein [Suillus bovinus]